MRIILKFICFVNILLFSVPLIQILASVQFLSQTKQIPEFFKKEQVYEKIAQAINDGTKTEDGSTEDFQLPTISGALVEAFISPVVSESLTYILGDQKNAPSLSLNKTLAEAKTVDPGLVRQIESFRLSAKEMFTPDMLAGLPPDQRKSAEEARAFLIQDKTVSLESYLLPVKQMISTLRLLILIFGALTGLSFLFLFLLSISWKSKVVTMAITFFCTGGTYLFVSATDTVLFGIIGNGIGGNELGEKFLRVFLPLFFDVSIRYFRAAAIGSAALFAVFLLARLMLFQHSDAGKIEAPTATKPGKKK